MHSWRPGHDLRVPRLVVTSSNVNHESHNPLTQYSRTPPPPPSPPLIYPAVQTPLVSFELSGIGSIIGPRFPFSPGWFVPFSIPTFEIPESEATCMYNLNVSILFIYKTAHDLQTSLGD